MECSGIRAVVPERKLKEYMKIHIFIAHMGVGGAERVCVNLANEFVKNSHEVHIVVLNLKNDIYTHLLDEGVQVHELGVSRLRYSFIPMLGYIKKQKPSFLFIFGNEMAVITNKLKKMHLTRVPIIVRVLNNVEISLSKEDKVSPIVENYLKNAQKQLNDMNHVIAQCEGMGKMLLKHNLVKPDHLSVVYNPVSRKLIEDVTELRGKKTDTSLKHIIFIGRIDPQKNLEHLLKAFAIAHEKLPDTVLHLIGDGNLTKQMKALSCELGIQPYVFFEGITKNMAEVYAKADLIALSSEYEGMPNCLIEAIGCGIPIVSYDCPLGPKEIVVDDVNGYLVEYNNIEQLANRIISALGRDWSSQIIKTTADKFDVKNIAPKYENIFKQYEYENRKEKNC